MTRTNYYYRFADTTLERVYARVHYGWRIDTRNWVDYTGSPSLRTFTPVPDTFAVMLGASL